jgi:hypothetical protein
MTIEEYACERCGEATNGDAVCGHCLSELELAAHPPFPRQSASVGDESVAMVARIRARLREHIAQRPPCPYCAASPSLVVDLLDAEQASAEILLSLDTLARLSRDQRFAVDPAAFDVLAHTARRWHAALASLTERLRVLCIESGSGRSLL